MWCKDTAITCTPKASTLLNGFIHHHRLLVEILRSQNLVSVAVAAHDLGEYVRFYPRGKM